MQIVTIGDNCMDVYSKEKKSYPGGNAVNVAVYLQRFGVESSYVGVVGSDQNGKQIAEAIRNKGVDVTHLHVKDGKTAVTYVELNGNDRQFVGYEEGVLADFTLSKEDIQFILGHEIVHSSTGGHCENYFQEFKQNGLVTSYDFSDDLDDPLILELIQLIDYPFFSYQKDDHFIRDFLIDTQKQGPKVVVATLGENGSLAYDGKEFYKLGVETVEVKDTMGAGDSFIAGFLYGVLNRFSIKECLKAGVRNAAKTITYPGAW